MLEHLLGQSVAAIDTPALVIDLDAMQRNLQRMQSFANTHGLALRPHAKMHKCAALAQLQMQAGAVGVCVQKVSEADVLARLGVHNIYISNEIVSLQKCERLSAISRRLMAQNGQLAVAVDSLLGIERLAQALQTHGGDARLTVFVEIDVGQGRCGVTPGAAALPLVHAIQAHPSLVFGGLQAYHGKAQHLRGVAQRREAIAQALTGVQQTRQALRAAGITVPLVTGAGTGSFALEAASGGYGELQVGSYLFMDADYAANELDAKSPHFEHALFVKSQIISASSAHAVCDAGHKSHAIDSGLPRVWAGHSADWVFVNGGDEHGILRGNALPGLGDTVWLVPGHCDPTVNLHTHMIGVRGGLDRGVVAQIFKVDTRGCVT